MHNVPSFTHRTSHFGLLLMLLCPIVGLAKPSPPAPLPEVQALISYESRSLSSEGVTKASSYRERWIRQGDNLWSQRLIPQSAIDEYERIHDAEPGLHKHFNHRMASRWVQRGPDGKLTLMYVDADHKVKVYYPEEEYGQAGFMPDWPSLSSLIRPAALATYRRLEDTGPAGSHWYEHQDAHQRIRLLWSEQLQLPLMMEQQDLDGLSSYRIQVELETPPVKGEAPWNRLDGYELQDIRDYFD